MIISKYSGNVVGYLDYYADSDKRVSAVTKVARSQRLRRGHCWPDTLAVNYVQFCRAQVSTDKIIKRSCLSGRRFCHQPGIYTSNGNYRCYYEQGSLLDIRV